MTHENHQLLKPPQLHPQMKNEQAQGKEGSYEKRKHEQMAEH